MASILYYSCHEILEYDDLRMFTSAGHTVFSTGAFSDPTSTGTQRLPRPEFFHGTDYADFVASGGMTWGGQSGGLNPSFVERFDVAIVNHVPEWVAPAVSCMGDQRVIYRTLGQSLLSSEEIVAPFRDKIKVVRYSDAEARLPDFMTTDKVIYFGKMVEDFEDPWTGGPRVVTFHNDYAARTESSVPNFAEYQKIAESLPLDLFGLRNDVAANWRGMATPQQQLEIYRNAGVYLYVPTTAPSYTLSLMEAMLSGTPVIAPSIQMIMNSYDSGTIARYSLPDRYEVADLLDHDPDLLFDSAEDARSKIKYLLSCAEKRSEVSARIRAKSREIFDSKKNYADWDKIISQAIGTSKHIA